jgi:hypothetical protein
MKKPVHILSAAIFAAILSLSAATAQGNAVQGEVRKIDGRPARSPSSTARSGTSAWTLA